MYYTVRSSGIVVVVMRKELAKKQTGHREERRPRSSVAIA